MNNIKLEKDIKSMMPYKKEIGYFLQLYGKCYYDLTQYYLKTQDVNVSDRTIYIFTQRVFPDILKKYSKKRRKKR